MMPQPRKRKCDTCSKYIGGKIKGKRKGRGKVYAHWKTIQVILRAIKYRVKDIIYVYSSRNKCFLNYSFSRILVEGSRE